MLSHLMLGRLLKAHQLISLAVVVCGPAVIARSAPERTVSVLYAGSLAGVMENGVGPAFIKATGLDYQGEAQGSLGAARMIRDRVRTPDVFISADPAVNRTVLMGAKNGEMVKWFMILASSQLVVAYPPQGKFAAKFEASQAKQIPWYEVLKMPGVRFGRGDPTIDPKGYRTLFLFNLAAEYYHRPDLRDLVGGANNPEQVFPEIALMGRVESGQLDAGIFYKHEVKNRNLRYIDLPPEINLGDPRFTSQYQRQSYITPEGEYVSGSPILLTIAIPEAVRHRAASISFVRFLLSSDQLLKQFGFGVVDHRVGGDAARVPEELRPLSSGVFQP